MALPAHARPIGLARDTRGSLAVEFALIAPLLLLVVAGLVDGARWITRTMQVRAAAQAGADHALRHAWDATKVRAAVTSATPLPVQTSPAPALITGCISGQSIRPTTGACPEGGAAGRFATISATTAFQPLMPWPGLDPQPTIRARAVVRLP